jgi:hypothetical protein
MNTCNTIALAAQQFEAVFGRHVRLGEQQWMP